jgi:hypothetical protein
MIRVQDFLHRNENIYRFRKFQAVKAFKYGPAGIIIPLPSSSLSSPLSFLTVPLPQLAAKRLVFFKRKVWAI